MSMNIYIYTINCTYSVTFNPWSHGKAIKYKLRSLRIYLFPASLYKIDCQLKLKIKVLSLEVVQYINGSY